MLQINANLTVSIEQLIINKKIGLAKKYYRKQKRSSFHFYMFALSPAPATSFGGTVFP